MQTCKAFAARISQALTKQFVTASLLFISGSLFGFVFCQSMPKMPDFPELSMPRLGDDFYIPKTPEYPKAPVMKKNDSEPEKKETVISDGTTTTDLLSSFLNSNNMLTAADITSLAESGSFSNLSSLSSLYNTGTGISGDQNNNAILKEILSSLEELKNNKSETEVKSVSYKPNERTPSILRFKINGYDIKDSLSTVYFSSLEDDGSFLLTADRRYIADQKVRNETFYILFKTIQSSGSSISYEVCPSVIQDNKNENSFIYKLSSLKKLTAQKTGNLVVLRANSKDCVADLLLDLDD